MSPGDAPGPRLERHLQEGGLAPLWLQGDAQQVLAQLPAACVDMAMTSPPYWGLRRYAAGGIGEERRREDYIQAILAVTNELARVLRPQGSLWLNLGDSYRGKGLQGIPWRVALRMVDEQGWILRNEVIWNKVKGGPDPARDKLRPVHEQLFHFVRQAKGYHYDDAAIRQPPKQARVVSGQAVSATGVSGVRYRRQIEGSTALSEAEKRDALSALEATLAQLAAGEIGDFRMVIRRQQRSTHSDAEQVSGRAKELVQRGFYFLRYNPKGSKIGDVWDVIPEDTQARRGHFAPYPEELCRTPILATCPPGGVVLDPFCGTGTTCKVAMSLGRRSVGIDLSADYLSAAAERCSVFGTHCDLDA